MAPTGPLVGVVALLVLAGCTSDDGSGGLPAFTPGAGSGSVTGQG